MLIKVYKKYEVDIIAFSYDLQYNSFYISQLIFKCKSKILSIFKKKKKQINSKTKTNIPVISNNKI